MRPSGLFTEPSRARPVILVVEDEPGALEQVHELLEGAAARAGRERSATGG